MSDRFSVYVLTEGKRDQLFIRGILRKIGVGRREMIFAPVSEGRGSGKQMVLDQFADQVRLCRRRNSRALTSLIVMMDADSQAVDRCMSDLDARLTESGQNRLDRESDRIARLIPKRNLETWILYLISNSEARDNINENADVKNQRTKEKGGRVTPVASGSFFEWYLTPLNRPTRLLDSLHRGLEEMPRAIPSQR